MWKSSSKKEHMKYASKHMRRCLLPLVLKEMLIKIRFFLYFVLTKIKRIVDIQYWQGLEIWDFLHCW